MKRGMLFSLILALACAPAYGAKPQVERPQAARSPVERPAPSRVQMPCGVAPYSSCDEVMDPVVKAVKKQIKTIVSAWYDGKQSDPSSQVASVPGVFV